MRIYTLAGGCFWCLDGVFQKLRGVTEVRSGFTGGEEVDPDYYDVATGKTGHAEAVQVTFDENIIPEDTLLDIFFLIHDPTSLNKQGADTGPQYRSAMFFEDLPEKAYFEHAIERAAKLWQKPIVTTLEPLTKFYPASEEHQDYYNKWPASGYCSIVIAPKIQKARKSYQKLFEQ